MKNQMCTKKIFLSLAIIGVIGSVTAAESSLPKAVNDFLEHPSHCATLLGGSGHEDSVSAEYSQAFVAALNAVKPEVSEAAGIALLDAGCRSRLALAGQK